MHIEHKGVDNRRYVIRFGIARPIPAQLIYYPSSLSNLHALVMPQTKAIVSIENVVASASINQRVDLNLITKNFVDVEYHPDRFPGLVFRLKVPKTATLVFSSGKMVCTGAKSEKQSREAVNEVVRRLRKGSIPIKNDAEIVIQNMVASGNLGGKVTWRRRPGRCRSRCTSLNSSPA